MCTMTVEYDSSNAVAVNFINEMKKLGVFKIVFENTTPKAQKATKTPKKEKPNHLLEELTNIKNNYPDNWDGEGAKAINPVVYANCVTIAKEGNMDLLGHWYLDFNQNGEVLLFANNNKGVIKIKEDNNFSFFLRNGNKYLRHENQSFSMKKINNILKLWEETING